MNSKLIQFYKEVRELKKINDLETKIMVLKDMIEFHKKTKDIIYTEEDNNILINLFKEKLNELQTK